MAVIWAVAVAFVMVPASDCLVTMWKYVGTFVVIGAVRATWLTS